MGPVVGTIFTDNASRSITDINPVTAARGDTGPYIGNYTIENDGFVTDPYGRSLNAFLQTLLANGYPINGTWTLETIDNNTSRSDHPGVRELLDVELEHGATARSQRCGRAHNFVVTNGLCRECDRRSDR